MAWGYWEPDHEAVLLDDSLLAEALQEIHEPLYVIHTTDGLAVAAGGQAVWTSLSASRGYPLQGIIPPCLPEHWGAASFRADYHLRFAYVSGSMATGIGSEAIVEALAEQGMLGFFGAAGLSPNRVEQALDRLQRRLPSASWGVNLIHSPHEPALEDSLSRLYLARGVKLVEASAYLDVTLPIVRYRTLGIYRQPDGRIVCPQRVMAKVSRAGVAEKFMAPPPERLLAELVRRGELTAEQASWAERIPLAQDITAEADSGGHTDNRPALTLFPEMQRLAARATQTYGYVEPLRVGLAGGIATPSAVAAAFAMGAAYVMVGSVHQGCVESGTSDQVREMLAAAETADVTMCPAADMFEMGVKVQVLKRGTMFPMRATRLYELYRQYPSLDALPAAERQQLEQTVFRCSLEEVWRQTQAYFAQRDPQQLERAARDPKHQMALVFRWYLGQSSRWANQGVPDRRADYQIWCGPAMGAFNQWVRGSFLQDVRERRVACVALNLLYGAAVIQRASLLQQMGYSVPWEAWQVTPLPWSQVTQRLALAGEEHVAPTPVPVVTPAVATSGSLCS
ncbi:MAG: 2-nitropropane dioxygenase [Planctomycetaceae bacterium]|nr:MAG: 2-nitropropane dioxygenase [Planctomycetaceae bacterium]